MPFAKGLLAFVLAFAGVTTSSAKVDIDLNGRHVYDLSGDWDFRMDPEDKGYREGWYAPGTAYQETITLPASMPERMKGYDVTAQTQWLAGLYDSSYYRNPYMEKYRVEGNVKVPFFLTPQKHYVGKAWYRKTVNIDRIQYKNGEPISFELFLERPHVASSVWINGKRLNLGDYSDSTMNTLSVPHVYYINKVDGLKVGENTITICVDNRLEAANVGKDSHSVSDQTQGAWNGIVGAMELREVGYVDAIKVYPDVDNKRALVKLELGGGNCKENLNATVTLTIESFNTAKRHIIVTDPVTVKLSSPSPTCVEIPVEMGDEMLLWDEHCPQMYRVTAEVKTKYRKTEAETFFGMRKIEIKDKMFYLNGKQIQLRGTVENCCFPLTGYPPTDLDSWLKLFKTCKQWGLNHMRFHTYCPPEAAFLAADLIGFYIQPEGPSWPNHGVRLGRGEFVDNYLYEEAQRICDYYGNHPSFTFFAFGNEPAGNWVKWSNEYTPKIKEYDPRHIYCGFSVGGGWAWQPNVEFAVKAGARGLNEWTSRAPESMIDFSEKINTYNGKDMPGTKITMPFVSHETGQWCAFPNFKEIDKYTGVNKARNFEIFRDILADNGMAGQAEKFLDASGKLQSLCYKYEIERTMRTPDYAGFQLLSLNDYSGQGTALVGLTDVFFDEKGYITKPEFREFCSEVVPLAKFPKFTYTTDETFEAEITLNQYADDTLRNVKPHWVIYRNPTDYGTTQKLLGVEAPLALGDFDRQSITIGNGKPLGRISVPLSQITRPGKYTLAVTIPDESSVTTKYIAMNHWDFWVYPASDEASASASRKNSVYVCDTLDAKALKVLRKGGNVLLCAAGKVSYGREVKQYFTPVFWNTSWFKMRPPHTTGLYIEKQHPVFADFPTDSHSNLQWWELVNKAQVMQFSDFPKDFQPIVQSIDTWFVSRKIGMLFEANVNVAPAGKKAKVGKLMMTTMDLLNNTDKRHVARQMYKSIINYMNSDKFNPEFTIDVNLVNDLFTKVAGEVNMYTNDSPDELKPKLK